MNESVRRLSIAGVVLLSAIFFLAGCGDSGTTPEVPTADSLDAVHPIHPESMSPQLAAYLPPFIEDVENDPGNYELHGELGLVYEANQMLDEALACFENAKALAPNEPLPRLHIANIKKAKGDHEGSLEDFRTIAEHFPDFAAGQHRYGVVALETGDVDAAEAAFARFIELLPERSHGYVGLGDVKLRQKDYAAAVENLEKALELNPDNGTAKHLLGQAYRGMGRREDAERVLADTQGAGALMFVDEWTKHMPPHAKSLSRQMRRGLAMLRYKRYDKAEEIFMEMLEWYPEQVEIHNNLAVTHGRKQEYDLAIEILKRAELINDTHQETLSNLALYHHRSGLDEEAVEYATRAVELAPTNTRFLKQKGGYLNHVGRHEEAIAPLRTATELVPQDAPSRRMLGEAYAALGRWEEAREQYQEAHALYPNHLWTQLSLADACLHVGARDEAREAYERAKAIDPDDPRVAELAARF